MFAFHLAWFVASITAVVVFFWIDFKIPLSVIPLDNSTELYSDRPYRIQGEHRLIGKAMVVPIERHHRTRIYLTASSPVTIYRLLSEVNPNLEFSGWRNGSEPVYAPGSDYVGNKNHLTRMVAHEFEAGTSMLLPGGPRFSAPIVVETDGDVSAYTLRFFNKIIPPLRQNKKKLLAAFGFILVFNAISLWFH